MAILRREVLSVMAEITDWQFADVFEAIAGVIPDRPAVVYGDQVVSWQSLDRRSNSLAHDMVEAGLTWQSKVAVYMPNRPEYVEAYHAAHKISAWPFNINYRYGADEIAYLLENADTEAVVFDTRFIDVVAVVRPRFPEIKRWYAVGDGCPDWATSYESVVADERVEAPEGPDGRSGTDVVLQYTGGTTGMPKGVMWQNNDLFHTMGGGGSVLRGIPAPETMAELAAGVVARSAGPVVMLACPLMHATAISNMYSTLIIGGTVVLLPGAQFDAAGLWDMVDRTRTDTLVIVGDAFARPLLAELDGNPGRWSLDSLSVISSAGVMWSREVKEGLFGHLRDDAMLIDVFGSSEAAAMGSSVSKKGDVAETASFMVGPLAQVVSESGGFVEPGSGEVGLAAFGGPMPVGYYNDEKKTAETFRIVEGKRWSVPGDYATVEVDGSMKLLGRGSVCINTGGEKVFVEEVEEVLKLHASVRDAVCVGIPNERFGETVCAIVELQDAGQPLDSEDVIAHVKKKLAGYKAPRNVVVVSTIGRAPSGKVDYKTLRANARAELGA